MSNDESQTSGPEKATRRPDSVRELTSLIHEYVGGTDKTSKHRAELAGEIANRLETVPVDQLTEPLPWKAADVIRILDRNRVGARVEKSNPAIVQYLLQHAVRELTNQLDVPSNPTNPTGYYAALFIVLQKTGLEFAVKHGRALQEICTSDQRLISDTRFRHRDEVLEQLSRRSIEEIRDNVQRIEDRDRLVESPGAERHQTMGSRQTTEQQSQSHRANDRQIDVVLAVGALSLEQFSGPTFPPTNSETVKHADNVANLVETLSALSTEDLEHTITSFLPFIARQLVPFGSDNSLLPGADLERRNPAVAHRIAEQEAERQAEVARGFLGQTDQVPPDAVANAVFSAGISKLGYGQVSNNYKSFFLTCMTQIRSISNHEHPLERLNETLNLTDQGWQKLVDGPDQRSGARQAPDVASTRAM